MVTFNKKWRILLINKVSLQTKKRLLKSLMWSIILQGTETSILSVWDEDGLTALTSGAQKRIKQTDKVEN